MAMRVHQQLRRNIVVVFRSTADCFRAFEEGPGRSTYALTADVQTEYPTSTVLSASRARFEEPMSRSTNYFTYKSGIGSDPFDPFPDLAQHARTK